MKISKTLNFDKFLIMPPAYYKYGDEEVINFYTRIINEIGQCNIILYNFEKLSGYKFSINCVEKLVDKFPKQIIGVKDSSYNLYENLKINNFSVMPGSESKLLKGLELGCTGIITATANITSALAKEVYDNFFNKSSQDLNKKLCDVRATFDKYNLIAGLHSFMSDKNEIYKNVLPPLKLLSETDKKELLSNLKKLDFNIETLKVV
jgi:4-hydroxy-tetrahydrodipicolinate synthase